MTNATVGQKVLCNGFEGRITAVCTGQLKGMVEVRLASGTVCRTERCWIVTNQPYAGRDQSRF